MIAEIITIGDELLIGQTIDTNSAQIASALSSMGVIIHQITSVSDDPAHITKALDNARLHADAIVLTGGLGPTKDDLTKKTLASYFNCNLILNDQVLSHVESLLASRGVEMNDLNRHQALIPAKATVLHNKVGTAPGMLFRVDGKLIFSLPGVPFEMNYLLNNEVLPLIMLQLTNVDVVHQTVMTFGLPESSLAMKISRWEDNLPAHIKLAYLPSPTAIKLRLSAFGHDRIRLQKEIDNIIADLQLIIPENIFALSDQSLEVVVGKLLSNNNMSLSLAESCTGGNIAHMITSVPGSSNYFTGSVVAYSNKVKAELLGVKMETLERYGAVSEQVVREMAEGCRALFQSTYAIATSGIAGPSGGSVDKPVGLTWISVAGPTETLSIKFSFGNSREQNILRASARALNMLRENILKKVSQ
ncbi:MAG TPA: competence/damage-inducible protein A [Williamwhitmania sp.]|nr:competence/damage-inducible protein A [Williamwhitmania sp.]